MDLQGTTIPLPPVKMNTLSIFFVLVAVLSCATAFMPTAGVNSRATFGTGLRMSDVQEKPLVTIQAPDFYWKFRLDRLAKKKGGELAYSEKSYPDADGFKDLYDCYYLDLVVMGKAEGFDWEAEKEISDSDWLKIYSNIAQWTTVTAKENRPTTATLPKSDFDLLKAFYPYLNFRDLETPLNKLEVGENFPYRTMKDMMSAAVTGDINVPGYSASSVTLDAAEAKKAVAALKERTMAKMENIFQETLVYANSDFPDDKSKAHYRALAAKLADIPKSPAELATYNAKMTAEVDDMVSLLAVKEEEHHGHDEEHSEPSAAELFEAKYGKSLEDMMMRQAAYKSDPVGYMEASIIEQHGKNGLDMWKKSQEFSEKLSVMSAADKLAAETLFSDFLKKA